MSAIEDLERAKDVGEVATDEDSYNEEEDEDFDPSKEVDTRGGDEAEDDDNEDNDYNEQGPDYSNIESGQGGLVRTRRGRALEELRMLQNRYEKLRETGISQQTISAWDELQKQSSERLRKSVSVMSEETAKDLQDSLKEEQILIDRKYEFAGEILHEKKMVPKSSAEAQQYLNSIQFKKTRTGPSAATKAATNEQGLKLRKVLKRPPILEQIIAGALKPKLTTLEKSKLDWATYVDKEGINEELTLHNKDGYLEKQDFLNRVETFKDKKYRQMRKTELQQRLAGS
ncbi:LAME_0C07668g1_1 [Lachancea meyersii CBS 8951]|uniref:SWR1-complex protein 5 n=1 Tax=Lachancea meyersii CBS 8951 TaxID=1266667 RepID=A0A1G4J2Y9_9SACH|nr:LAME_0C07668g1_1 [Lachancea meyersii CBS 8951]